MRYHVVAVGRMRDAALRAACNRYLERLRRYTKVEEREVKAEARILDAVAEGSCLVALAEQGDQWTSAQLADWTARWELDRKSTRLNSSHLVISYAVFCLKKKKKKIVCERANRTDSTMCSMPT